MKIKLNSNGQIIDTPIRVAQRYIRMGRAHLVEEAKPVEIKETPKTKKVKKERVIEVNESEVVTTEETPSEYIPDWRDS